MRMPIFDFALRTLSASPAIEQTWNQRLSESLPATTRRSSKAEVAGGSPFSLCEVSQPTDLLNITNDGFLLTINGTFQDSLECQATRPINVTIDCGSHCEMYGIQPGETPGISFAVDFDDIGWVEQPASTDGPVCSVDEGPGSITATGFVWPILLRSPGWYNITFDAIAADGRRIYCLTTEVCLRWEDEEMNKKETVVDGPWAHCAWPR